MEKFKRVLLRLLYPGVAWTLVLTALTAALYIFCFMTDRMESVFAYTAYALSAYVLTVVLVAFIPFIVQKPRTLLHRNKYISRYLSDVEFKTKVSLYQGLFINLLFVAFKFTMSLVYRSFWFGAVAVYYIILSVIRFVLLRNERKISSKESKRERFAHGVRTYRFCGCLMLILNTTMAGMIFQMIWQNKGYQYPWMIVYASATYTFYSMITAIINLVKYRKMDNPVLSAAKMLGFAGALMSILTLQTAMLAEFGNGYDDFRQIMNTATGFGVSTIVFGMAIFMIVRANKALAKLQINNSQT